MEQVAMVCIVVCLEEKNMVEGLFQVTGVRKAAMPPKEVVSPCLPHLHAGEHDTSDCDTGDAWPKEDV
jgi:hypothetical protein